MLSMQTRLILGALLAVLLVTGSYLVLSKSGSSPEQTMDVATTTTQGSVLGGINMAGNGKIELVSESNGPTGDDMNRLIQKGTDYKKAGDYANAAKTWESVSSMWPQNIISFNNLGDLYMNYLKDYPKAEKNYLQHITNRSDDPNAYRTLFELYTTTSYKPSSTAAEDILKKGIANNTQAYDLNILLARYYKAAGRTAEAKAQYDLAIGIVTRQGNASLAAQIDEEAKSAQ